MITQSEERATAFLGEFGSVYRLIDARVSLTKLFDQHAAEARADQQEICADAVIAELKSIGFQIYQLGEDRIRNACLGATGERDG